MTFIRSLLRAVAFSSTAILLAGLFFSFAGKILTEVIPVAEAKPYQGKAFYVQMPQAYVSFGTSRPDSNQDSQASSLAFFVDGKSLAPHQLHADLISGKPGFSHWGDSVIFSTGSSDLKGAAKELRIVVPLRVAPYVLWPALGLLIVSLGILYRESCLSVLRSVNGASKQIGGIVSRLKLPRMLNPMRFTRIWLYVAVFCSSAILISGLFLSFADKTHTAVLPIAEAQPYQGKAFIVQTPQAYVSFGAGRPDTNHDSQASSLAFFVDGKPLSPHQLHADLISGKPGFSHWGDSVIFSTGNPDLKESAKELRIVMPLQLPLYVLWLAFALFIVSLWSLYRENCLAALRSVNSVSAQIGWIMVGGFSLLIVWSVWAGYPEIPIVPLDGLGYITWSPKVPIGYPAFISLFAKLFSNLTAVIFAQVILYCIAVLFLYWQALKFAISPFVAALVALLLLGAGRVMNYNLLISTDGLFATLIVFHMAAVLSVIRSSSTSSLIATGITIGLAIFVRPAAYFMLGGLFVLFAVVSGQRLRILKIAGSSVAMVMLFIFIVTSVTQGKNNRSILGLALFPHVMHLYKPLESSLDTKDISAIDNVTRDYRLSMHETMAQSWRSAYDLEASSFNPISGKIYAALYAETGPTETRRLEILSIFEKLAHETILNDPIGYFKIVAINFYAAYTRNTFLVSPPGYANHEGAPLSWWFEQTRENALSGIKQLGLPVPNANSAYGNGTSLVNNPPKHLDLLHYFSPLQRFVALAAAPLLILGLFFSRSKKDVSLVGVYALTLHVGGTLLVCLTTVAIPRYSVPLDVLMIIAIGCAVDVSGFHIKSFVAKFLRLNHA